MQYDRKTLSALAVVRMYAKHPNAARPVANAIEALDKAGVFAAIDEAAETSEAERHMEAIRTKRAARCTCSARRAGMQDTDIHVLGCPAIDVPSPRGSARMDCPPVGEPLTGNTAREVAARLREQIGDDRFDFLFPGDVSANPQPTPNQCPTCDAAHFANAEALQFHIDAAH